MLWFLFLPDFKYCLSSALDGTGPSRVYSFTDPDGSSENKTFVLLGIVSRSRLAVRAGSLCLLSLLTSFWGSWTLTFNLLVALATCCVINLIPRVFRITVAVASMILAVGIVSRSVLTSATSLLMRDSHSGVYGSGQCHALFKLNSSFHLFMLEPWSTMSVWMLVFCSSYICCI